MFIAGPADGPRGQRIAFAQPRQVPSGRFELPTPSLGGTPKTVRKKALTCGNADSGSTTQLGVPEMCHIRRPAVSFRVPNRP